MKKLLIPFFVFTLSHNIFSASESSSSNHEEHYLVGLKKAQKSFRALNPLKENETEVLMGESQEIHVEETDQQEKAIFTNGLAGCAATAIAVKCANGFQMAAMQHFPPTERIKHARTFDASAKSFFNMCEKKGGVKEAQAILVRTIDRDEHNNIGKRAFAGLLQCTMQQYFSKSHILTHAYSGWFHANNKLRDDFRVTLRSNGKSSYYSKSDDHVAHDMFEESNDQ